MNDSESWAQAFRLYEQLRVVVDMKDSNLWAQGYRCYAQHKAINEMENSNSWVISQPKGSFAAQRWWKEGKKFFAAVSQLQNTLRNGALAVELGVFMLHSHFAAVKHPAKWGLGCEIGSFYASQSFYSCKTPCEMGLWLRNLEFFMLRSHFAAAKWGSLCCEMALVCQKVASQLWNPLRNGAFPTKMGSFMLWWFAAVSQLRNDGHCVAKWHSCAKSGFAERGLRLQTGFAAKCWFRGGYEISQTPVFALFLLRFLSPKDFLSISLHLILPEIIQKPILHQNKLELKHWNQN